jgi:hypothetical protein
MPKQTSKNVAVVTKDASGIRFEDVGGSLENYTDKSVVQDPVTKKPVKENLGVFRSHPPTATCVKRIKYGSSEETRTVKIDSDGEEVKDEDGNKVYNVIPAVESVVCLVRLDFSGIGSFSGKNADTLMELAFDGFLTKAKKHIDRSWKYDGNRTQRRFDIRVTMRHFSRESTPEEDLMDAAFEVARKNGSNVTASQIQEKLKELGL